MNISMRKLADVLPYANNPRLNDHAVDAVAASIREFGFRQPLVVDRNNVIVVGHVRYKAALKLGLEEVPVHEAVGLTPLQITAYRIADNQSATIADWNLELLPLELEDLRAQDFDLGQLGFSPEELAEIMAPPAVKGLADPDEVPAPPDQAITQLGESLDLGQPPVALRRLEQMHRCGQTPHRRDDSAGKHRPSV